MVEENNEGDAVKVDYNLKGRLIQTIGENLHEATAYFSYNPMKSFIKLKAIRILITHRLESQETKSLKGQEVILNRALSIPYQIEKMRFGGTSGLNSAEAIALGKELMQLRKQASLESYFEELMTYLNKYGFLLGEKEDESTSGFN